MLQVGWVCLCCPRLYYVLYQPISAVKANPIRRQTALKTFSRNARVRVEEVRGNEKVRI